MWGFLRGWGFGVGVWGGGGGERVLDRVNMYASAWICRKVGGGVGGGKWEGDGEDKLEI